MSDQKITALTADSGLASGDFVPFVDISDTTMASTGTTKKATITDLMAQAPVQSVAGKTGAVTLVPSDAGAQPSNATLTSLAALSNAAGSLTNNGSGTLSWAAGGGGQTLYDLVVDPAGTYTTLGAALAVATAGQTIFVRNGTYTETTYNPGTPPNNITIVGESPMGTVIDLNGIWTLAGRGWNVSGLKFQNSAGRISISGGSVIFNNCFFSDTSGSNAKILEIAAGYSYPQTRIENCYFSAISGSTTSSNSFITLAGTGVIFANNYLVLDASTNIYPLNIQGSNHTITGNTFLINSSNTGALLVGLNGGSSVMVTGNNFIGGGNEHLLKIQGNRFTVTGNSFLTGNGWCIEIVSGKFDGTISGNTFYTAAYGVNNNGATTVSITGNAFTSITNPIYINNTNDNVISSNTINGGTTAIKLDGTSSNNLVMGNRTAGAPTTGILINAAGCTSNLVSSNITAGATTGITDNGTTTTKVNNI